MTGGIDMKQEMPSTFILNRNDKQYFYVEGKQSRLHGPVYHVYYNKKEKTNKKGSKLWTRKLK